METAHVKVDAFGRITKERLHFEVAGFYGELANHTGYTFTHSAPHALQPSRARYSSRLNRSTHAIRKIVLIHRHKRPDSRFVFSCAQGAPTRVSASRGRAWPRLTSPVRRDRCKIEPSLACLIFLL